MAVALGLFLPGASRADLLSEGVLPEANAGESTWQGTWYTLVDTGGGPKCEGVIGSDSWTSTFAKDWGSGSLFGTHSERVCFIAEITIYVRQSGAYRFDLENVDDGARLLDDNGDVLFEAACGFLYCPAENGDDVNLPRGKTQMGLQYWEWTALASISFLAADKSIFSNAAPTVSFTYSPSTILVGDSVSFSDLSVDPEGDAMSFSWNIGGASYSQRNPAHTFGSTGTYLVTLTVTDEFGASASASQDVVVRATPPVASTRASPASGEAPLEVAFTCSGAQGTPPFSFEWNFGDDSPTVSGGQVTHSYSKAGTFTVTCTTRDAAGQTDTASVIVSVSAPQTRIGPFAFGDNTLLIIIVVATAVVVATVVLQYRRMRRKKAMPPPK